MWERLGSPQQEKNLGEEAREGAICAWKGKTNTEVEETNDKGIYMQPEGTRGAKKGTYLGALKIKAV